MELNLPAIEQLLSCKNLLIAGMGGGFDIFCGLPLYFELQRRGQNVHLASLSFSQIRYLKDAVPLTDRVAGVTAQSRTVALYFPEWHLARWLKQERGEDATLWCINAMGALPIRNAYRALIQHLAIDGILLVDGGVDSLMRGDEADMGTILEDSCSLAAVNELDDLAFRGVACTGLGAEEDVAHAHVFENIAALAGEGGFLGSCSLVREMEAYQSYEAALNYVHGQRGQDPSVINASIVSAVQGHFGDYHLTEKTKGSRLWISPLMPLYWFFDLPALARRNLFLPHLRFTNSFGEALQIVSDCRQGLTQRPASRIPLR